MRKCCRQKVIARICKIRYDRRNGKEGSRMKNYTLEVCVDSAESAEAAVRGGADRLELCGNLVIGGTTPEQALFEKIRGLADIKVNVLIRPRYGDFLYTDYEFDIISRSVMRFREMGADGVVVGCLLPDGSLDVERMKRLAELAGSMDVTLHRAFDMCREPYEALEQAKTLGIRTILTSGQQESCWEGRELIAGLVKEGGGQVDIMAGGGVEADTIWKLASATGAVSYHMSGKVVLDSRMVYRKREVSMGLPGLDEYRVFRTSEEKVRAAKGVLNAFSCDFTGVGGKFPEKIQSDS